MLAPAKLSMKMPPFGGVDPAGLRFGVSPQNKISHGKPTPRSNFCLLAPAQFSTQIPSFRGMDPAGPRFGVSPPKIKFYMANPPRGATFVCWPPPNSQRIHPHLVEWTLRAPGLGEPPINKILHGKPTLKSNFCLLATAQFLTLQRISDWVSMGGTPGGRQTHTHTHFHLYILD